MTVFMTALSFSDSHMKCWFTMIGELSMAWRSSRASISWAAKLHNCKGLTNNGDAAVCVGPFDDDLVFVIAEIKLPGVLGREIILNYQFSLSN